MYFVIQNSDGDTHVNQYSKEELLEELNNEDSFAMLGFLGRIEESDTNYWGENCLIIKGEIVKPEPKQVIEAFEIE